MLTKDLLRFRKANGYLKPSFIDVSDKSFLKTAEQLISLYSLENKYSKKELTELTTPIIKTCKNQIIAKGFNKLLLDRCEFTNISDTDFPELRKKIFIASANLLKSGSSSYKEYRRKISSSISEVKIKEKAKNKIETTGRNFCTDNIYADLPDNEKLINIKRITSIQLLERYNCSLVQSLLLNSNKVTVTVEDAEPAKMRRLLKYLKFFRLLALIRPVEKGKNKFKKIIIEIDGPTNLFENTKKYGLQLASFFPAICSLSKWKLTADIKLKNGFYKLTLNEKSNLKSHYHNFTSYIPEEYAMFYKLFNSQIKDWKIIDNSSFIDIGNQELIFPDFSFKSESGKTINIEFFHRWHYTQLLQRIIFCEKNENKIPLIIGVDRFLYNKPEVKEKLDSSIWFSNYGLLFRDFPGVERVHKKLTEITGGQ